MVPLTSNVFLATHLFLKMVALETCLFEIWVRVVKKECTATVSEIETCQVPGSIYAQAKMCSELHFGCWWKTHTCVERASDVRFLYAGCSVFTHQMCT